MKKVLLVLTLFELAFITKAQEASVEKSTSGIQTGFLGIWVHNEAKLTPQIALRGEIGFDSGIFGGSFYDGTRFILAPVITLEPKWYYNLKRRSSKSKIISGNSGNFLSLKSSYNPDWFVISNYDNITVVNQIAIIPTWGIRRNIGKHFNYETGIGLGFRYFFAESAGYAANKSEAVLNLHLRIGYRFGGGPTQGGEQLGR